MVSLLLSVLLPAVPAVPALPDVNPSVTDCLNEGKELVMGSKSWSLLSSRRNICRHL